MRELMETHGFADVQVLKDLAGWTAWWPVSGTKTLTEMNFNFDTIMTS